MRDIFTLICAQGTFARCPHISFYRPWLTTQHDVDTRVITPNFFGNIPEAFHPARSIELLATDVLPIIRRATAVRAPIA